MSKTFTDWYDEKFFHNMLREKMQEAWNAGYTEGFAACQDDIETEDKAERERYAYENIKDRLALEYNLPTYDNSNHQQFCSDILRAIDEGNLDSLLQHYNGRFYYSGPAITAYEISVVVSRTKVLCQWDNMGRGFIVYPR